MRSVTTRTELEALPRVGLQDVREGDMVFVSSDGGLQHFCRSIGELWVHIAFAVERGGEMYTAEVGVPATVCSRPLTELIDEYAMVAISTPDLPSDCLQRAIAQAHSDIDNQLPNNYPWEDVWTALITLLTRRAIPYAAVARLEKALEELSGEASPLVANAKTCSHYVQSLYGTDSRRCQLEVPVKHPLKTASARPAGVPAMPTLGDLLAADDSQRQWILGQYSLLELAHNDRGRTEGQESDRRPSLMAGGVEPQGLNGSWTSPQQFGEVISRFGTLINSLVNLPSRSATELSLDERWVTPTDLWLSPSAKRKRVVISRSSARVRD